MTTQNLDKTQGELLKMKRILVESDKIKHELYNNPKAKKKIRLKPRK